ncbi:MAG: hypothetical protein KA712_02425 [Myxococcales bacterium]|nr:hypothetical protein [Myxococcales bacterium]
MFTPTDSSVARASFAILCPGALLLALVTASACTTAPAKPAGTAAPARLAGVVDMHCHTGPDVVPRALDDTALARAAEAAGLRAIVLKNHVSPTAARAALATKSVERLTVMGGIVLNRAVGGLNATAVDAMARMEGRHGRVVWLPTFDAENQVRREGRVPTEADSVAVVRDDQVVAALEPILELVRTHGLVLATGHLSPREALVVVKHANARGIDKLLVTHALSWPVNATPEDLAALAAAGAFLELVLPISRGGKAPPPDLEGEMNGIVAAFAALGAGPLVLSSDLGQQGNPSHPDGLGALFERLRQRGISQADLDRAAKENPARLLGLAGATP